RKKAMKHFGEGSLVTLPLSGHLVEALPPVEQGLREGVSVRAFVYPSRPLGGPKTEVEALTKLLKKTSLREEKAV
ncbi:hypothetical protein A2U01_0100722, partial [Trifolium medium]|nr:hypothetical protein [Trifolium medium]